MRPYRPYVHPLFGLLAVVLFVSWGAVQVSLTAQSDDAATFVPVTDAMLQDPAPSDWLMWRRTLNGWGYSPLDQINRDNVDDLRLVWTRALSTGSQTGTPLAYGGVLYMPNPNDLIQAIDAVTGDLIWEHRRDNPDDVYGGFLSQNNRNIAIHGNLIIDTSVDDHIFALDADTGEIVWYYQHLNDHWDMDHPFERLLVDTAVAPDAREVSWINPRLQPGEVRKVVTGIPGKTGVVYTLDRETGEFLWATPTVGQNLINDIDGATGNVTENPEVVFSAYGQEILSCPGWLGGKDWEAGAYSPLTNTMYYPLRNSCAQVLATPDQGLAIYQLRARFQLAPGIDQLGTVRAINLQMR